MQQSYDVIVVGGGNAALCAALSARKRGAKVGRTARRGESSVITTFMH